MTATYEHCEYCGRLIPEGDGYCGFCIGLAQADISDLDMIHDPDMLKEGSVIFDKESLANGKKKLRYSWKMTDMNLKRNKARMTIRRYLSLISNKELRRRVFGF